MTVYVIYWSVRRWPPRSKYYKSISNTNLFDRPSTAGIPPNTYNTQSYGIKILILAAVTQFLPGLRFNKYYNINAYK